MFFPTEDVMVSDGSGHVVIRSDDWADGYKQGKADMQELVESLGVANDVSAMRLASKNEELRLTRKSRALAWEQWAALRALLHREQWEYKVGTCLECKGDITVKGKVLIDGLQMFCSSCGKEYVYHSWKKDEGNSKKEEENEG